MVRGSHLEARLVDTRSLHPAAIKENRPERVMFWYHFLPSTSQKPNWWFDRILKDASDLGVTGSLLRALARAPVSPNRADLRASDPVPSRAEAGARL